MTKWLGHIRAAIGTALVWAVAWAAAGGVLARFPGFGTDLPLPILFAGLGFLTGIIFTGTRAAIDGRRELGQAALWTVVGSGVISGLLLTGMIVAGAAYRGEDTGAEFLLFGPPLILGGAVSAAGSLAFARWAGEKGPI